MAKLGTEEFLERLQKGAEGEAGAGSAAAGRRGVSAR